MPANRSDIPYSVCDLVEVGGVDAVGLTETCKDRVSDRGHSGMFCSPCVVTSADALIPMVGDAVDHGGDGLDGLSISDGLDKLRDSLGRLGSGLEDGDKRVLIGVDSLDGGGIE